jgi:hypothetical protein
MELFSEVTRVTCIEDYKQCTQHATQYMYCAQHGILYAKTIWIYCIIDMGSTIDVRYQYVLYVHTYIHTYMRTYERMWSLQQNLGTVFQGSCSHFLLT